MSQHDMIIANADGATVRADINAALQALASTNGGSSRPATAYAGQLWLDTNTPSGTVWTLYMFDGADDIEIGKVDSTNNRFSVVTSQAADVASASTIDLDAAYGMVVDVTGTTAITAVTLAQGGVRIVRFTGALTFTHGSSLVLPGAANITTAAGDYAILAGYAAGVVRCVAYIPNAAPLSVATQAQMEAGSSTAVVVTPGRQQFHPSSPKFWVAYGDASTATIAASYNVSSLTDNGTGDCTINFTTAFSSSAYAATFGVQAMASLGANSTGGHAAGSLRVLGFASGSATDIAQAAVIGCGDQ